MGRRTSTETIVAIVHAFLQQRTWQQAELAREIGVGVKALRARLDELSQYGFPLSEEKDHPHVYWSVPQDWFPGGVLLKQPESEVILRLLGRLPKSKDREAAISLLVGASARGKLVSPTVVAPSISETEANHLALAEDSARENRPLRIRYFSANRGSLEWRSISVQRILPGPPARLCAICHRDGTLKWFRVDNIFGADPDLSDPFRRETDAEVDSFVGGSLHGFVDEAVAVHCTFIAREPDWRWIRKSFVSVLEETPVPDGVRLTISTRGVLALARLLAGLGDLVRIETPAIRALVLEIAQGSVKSAQAVAMAAESQESSKS